MIKLYVSTFGDSINWIKGKQMLLPIEVGCARRNADTVHYDIRDDTKNNISELNEYFGELTGLYWIWKNEKFKQDDIVGFAHYNKILDIRDRDIERILMNREAEWIVRDPVCIPQHSYPEDINILISLLKADYPQYYEAWNHCYDAEGSSEKVCFNCELFYTSSDEFEKYCEFLFSVLFKVYSAIGKVEREPYHKRYCAFLGERLLTVYLYANDKTMYSALIEDNAKYYIRFIRKVSRILGLNRDSALVKSVRHILKRDERKSSYLK